MKITWQQAEELRKLKLIDEEQEEKELAEREAERERDMWSEIEVKKNNKKYLKLSDVFNPLDFSRDYTEEEYNAIIKMEERFIRAEDVKLPKSGIHIEEKEGLKYIPDDRRASLVTYGDMAEITVCFNHTNGNGLKNIRKLPGNKFLRTDTGEIFEGKKNSTRTESNHNLNKSIQMIRKTILDNFKDSEGQFVTFTYNCAMKDYENAKIDIKPVLDVFRYRKLDYLWVIEPKIDGSWHYHILVKPKKSTDFELEEKHLKKAWTHGSIYIEPITTVEGLALYLGHTTDTDEVKDDEQGIFMLTDNKYTKKRRSYYPSGAQIYDSSRGIKKPKKAYMSYGEAKEKIKGYKQVNSCCKVVRQGNTNGSHVVNIVNYETHKRK